MIRIEYQRSARRLIRRRRTLIAGLCGIILITFSNRAYRLAKRLTLLCSQYRCMNYDPGIDVIAYEERPKGGGSVANGDTQYAVNAIPPDNRRATCFYPSQWRSSGPQLSRQFQTMAIIAGSSWQPITPPAVLFLHKRNCIGAEPRLVVVYCILLFKPPSALSLRFTALSFQVATWSRDAALMGIHGFGENMLLPGHDHDGSVRLRFGEEDSSDPSRFVIKCKVGDRDSTIVGRLLPDDDVALDSVVER